MGRIGDGPTGPAGTLFLWTVIAIVVMAVLELSW